ncbi:MAG TPA: sensor histidine kinase [Usitatibacter sp.]|nr:sensor histidine kinase [Usitatibacter sp.]
MPYAVPCGAQAGDAPAREDPWRVVLIRNWDAMYPINVTRETALRAALMDNPERVVEIYPEEIDSLRFGEAVDEEMVSLLRRKYKDMSVDLVIASGREPLLFAARHRAELWPGVPIVFNGVTEGELAGWKRPERTTGVTMIFDVEGTLALGAALVPSARAVYFVSGASDFDRFYLDMATRQARRFGRLEVRFIAGATQAETLARVAAIGPDAFVVYLTMLRDATGQIAAPGLGTLPRVVSASRVPVLASIHTQLGRGALAGSFARVDEHGRIAGLLARSVLEGADPDAIAVKADPQPVCQVDWNGLYRWAIPERNVPKACSIINRPPSLWETYFWPMVALIAIIVLQAVLISSLVIEIRRRRIAEDQSRERGAELARVARLSTVGALTASIAHEINQPMGAILSNAEAAEMMLDQGTLETATLREILADIRTEDLRASEVIQRLRKLLGERESTPVAMDVNREVAEALRHLAFDAARRGVMLTPVFSSEVPAILGDPVQVQQVIINLVVNAMDAVGQEPERQREVWIETRAVAGGAQAIVADRGPGLAPQDEARLFHSNFTSKKDGMGFGLSIVRTITEMHGGSVGHEPNVPHGSIFRVTFPAVGT